jgi:GT2 family glycosyltransferase
MNNSNFTLIWSFRNRVDVLIKSIETAHQFCPIEVDFCLVDASSNEETIKKLRTFCNTIENRTIRICESTYRSTLSEAWNLGMMLTKNRYVMFASSDTIFVKSGWYEALYNQLVNNQLEYVLVENHALFGFDKQAIPKMGWFDERYILGPHFDVDFMIRASEHGIKFNSIGNDHYYNHGDVELGQRSTTEIPDRLPMNNKTNENIFRDKWHSGWPGWVPVNGDPNNLAHPPTHISQVRRNKPEIDPHPFYTVKCK